MKSFNHTKKCLGHYENNEYVKWIKADMSRLMNKFINCKDIKAGILQFPNEIEQLFGMPLTAATSSPMRKYRMICDCSNKTVFYRVVNVCVISKLISTGWKILSDRSCFNYKLLNHTALMRNVYHC